MEDWVCWVTAQKAAPNPTYMLGYLRLRGIVAQQIAQQEIGVQPDHGFSRDTCSMMARSISSMLTGEPL